MEYFSIHTAEYNTLAYKEKYEIARLMQCVWPNNMPTMKAETHPYDLHVRSFCLYQHAQLVAYTGIVRKQINHAGQKFTMAGLSCVATHPKFQGKGLGHCVVAEATRWIERDAKLATQDKKGAIDLGIFTCHPSLAAFYKAAGNWPVVQGITLIGSEDASALSSKTLDVVVLMRLFSAHAREYALFFHNTTISLGFPVGQFI